MNSIHNTLRFLACLIVLAISTFGSVTSSQEVDDLKQLTSYGRRQIDQMLCDRPSMDGIVSRNTFVWTWVEAEFNGRSIGERIYWDHREPSREGEHQIPFDSYPPLVRISGKKFTNGNQKWQVLIFELFNLQRHQAVSEAHNLALAGEIDRAEYVKRLVQQEYIAMQVTYKFLQRAELKTLTEKGLIFSTEVIQTLDSFDKFWKYLDTTKTGEYDPRAYFGQCFDEYTNSNIQRSEKARNSANRN